MTTEEVTTILVRANTWLSGPGANLPGAAAARHGIANLAAPQAHHQLPSPNDNNELIERVISEGEFLRNPSVPNATHVDELRAAVTAAIQHAVS